MIIVAITLLSNWISDAVTPLRLESVRFGPLQKTFAGLVDWIDLHLFANVRFLIAKRRLPRTCQK